MIRALQRRSCEQNTPDKPLLAPALHRHLRELPSVQNGLGFTQQMALTMLAEAPRSLYRMIGRMTYFIDPLPGQGDSQVRDRVLQMEGARERVFTRQAGLDQEGRARPPWTDVLTLMDLGRAVLAGEVILNPSHRRRAGWAACESAVTTPPGAGMSHAATRCRGWRIAREA